ncbi:hypothetical protein FOCC_FOCC008914 [Frankliniella occidentalis]|nr:hypothetical protein FOCC_FOCC008914 [Frankliniella occidentalis]
MMYPRQFQSNEMRPARRLPVVHSVRDYPEHLNPFRDDVDEDGSAVPPPLPGMEDDEPTLRPTQDKFGTWTVPRRRSHLNFEQTCKLWPALPGAEHNAAVARVYGLKRTAALLGPRLAAGPSTSGAPTPAPRPPVKPRKKRKAPPPPPPPKAQQRLSSAVSLPQLSQSEGEALANAQPAVTQSQSQVSLACHQDDALSRSASPEDRVGSNPTGPSEPREAPSVEEPDEPPPASGSPVPIHEAGPTSTESSLPETEVPEQDAASEERGQSTPPCEDERSGNDSPPAPPRQQDPLSGSPISQRSFRSSTPEAVIMAVEQAPREGGHEEHSPTPSPRSSTSRASSSPEPPLPPPPALSTSPGSSPQGSSPHSSPSPLRAASPERLEQSATSEECPSPPTPASPCSPTRSNEASPTAPTPSPPPPPASPESTARPHCPLAKPEEDADEEDGDAACREDLSKVIAPAASLITSPRPHLQV